MKKLIILLIILSGCVATQPNPEQFIYQDQDIYHVSSKQDTTLLNYNDLKVLKNDSLQDKYLELNTER